MIITKLLLSGAAATGKSSLIALLLGQPPVLEHDSTLLSRPLRHARLTAGKGDSDQKWESYDDPEELMELLADGIEDVPIVDQSEQSQSTQEPVRFLSDETSTQKTSLPKSRTLDELVLKYEDAAKSNRLQNIHWIYTVDSGGQPAFLDVLPAFIRCHSVTIHTVKLNKALDDPVEMVFSVRGKTFAAPEKLCLTNIQLIKTLVRSVSSTHFKFHPSRQSDAPYCIIVGTFKDELESELKDKLKDEFRTEDYERAINRVDCQLRNSLNYSSNVHKCQDRLIFPVNTVVEGEEREEVAAELRGIITDTNGTSQEIDIPVRWFVFELELRKQAEAQDQGILSIDKCKEVGRRFEMNDDEALECVKYLHEQTLLLYFDKCLPNTVFIHAQSILDKVSAILLLTYFGPSRIFDKIKRRFPRSSCDDLKKTGLFNRDLINCLCTLSEFGWELKVTFPALFTAENFLNLLEYLLVIAQVPGQNKFFIPCVLPTQSPSEQQKTAYLKCISELVLFWKDMPLPQGLFPALVVQLLQRKTDPCFTVPPQTYQEQQLRHAITLISDSTGGGILLVDSVDWLEVYFTGRRLNCPQIRHAILEGVSEIVTKFEYQSKMRFPIEGFICWADGCKSSPHPCYVRKQEGISTAYCTKAHWKNCPCSDKHLCWFEKAGTYGTGM